MSPSGSGAAQGRHARQIPIIGTAGQARLASSRALIVGLGGLGAPAALYLAGAGVGTLGLMDFDRVELSNLHRQPLYTTADVGRPKLEAARERLHALNPDVHLVLHPERLDAGNAIIVADYDVVLSCTDDVEAQYALSDACQRAGVPLVHAAVSQWEGELTVFLPGGACLRCLRPTPTQAPGCAVEGVLGPVPGVLGAMQAAEALKVLVGESSLTGRLLLWDARTGSAETIAFERRASCNGHVSGPVACPLPWNAPQVPDISAADFEARRGEFFLVDVREPEEFAEVRIPGSTLIPLGELPRRLGELPRNRSIVIHCAVGGRSARATELLREHGFAAWNLRGGIQAWLASFG